MVEKLLTHNDPDVVLNSFVLARQRCRVASTAQAAP
jgi:hypothetical protein